MGIGRGKLIVSGDEVRKVFDPVVNEVRRSIWRQVRDMPASKAFKGVVIGGGFMTRLGSLTTSSCVRLRNDLDGLVMEADDLDTYHPRPRSERPATLQLKPRHQLAHQNA